jgi:hypothetical protein
MIIATMVATAAGSRTAVRIHLVRREAGVAGTPCV